MFLSGGPFVISCGEHNDKYLSVVEIAHKKQVGGVEERANASIFYIQTKDPPSVFNFVHYGSEDDDRFNKTGLYLTANTRFGHNDGPLEVGGAKATDFILNHPSKENGMLSIEFWERDGCYVRLAPRTFHISSFMGFDEADLKTVCVSSLKYEGKNNIWLRFQLHRIRNECSERITTYGSSQKQDSSKEGSEINPRKKARFDEDGGTLDTIFEKEGKRQQEHNSSEEMEREA